MPGHKLVLVGGIVLLIVSLVLYVYLSYIDLPYKDVPDDMVSWFHLHVIDYLRSGGDPHNDTYLRLIDGRNLYLSPILIDLVVLTLNVSPWYLVLFMGIMYILLDFVSTFFVPDNIPSLIAISGNIEIPTPLATMGTMVCRLVASNARDS